MSSFLSPNASGAFIDGEGFLALAGCGTPSWKKNGSRIYVVVYPSDYNSSWFLADRSRPLVQTEGAGYGIFAEPMKVSKTKFWKGKASEPTLFTVEGGVPGAPLMTRQGAVWGVNGMLLRFLMDSKDKDLVVSDIQRVLEPVAARSKAGNEAWLREALLALSDAGFIRRFYVDEFVQLAKGIVAEKVHEGASWDRVTTMDYEEHIVKTYSR